MAKEKPKDYISYLEVLRAQQLFVAGKLSGEQLDEIQFRRLKQQVEKKLNVADREQTKVVFGFNSKTKSFEQRILFNDGRRCRRGIKDEANQESVPEEG